MDFTKDRGGLGISRIDYFYETLELFAATPAAPTPRKRSLVTVDLESLTQRDKLELAVELIHNVLQET